MPPKELTPKQLSNSISYVQKEAPFLARMKNKTTEKEKAMQKFLDYEDGQDDPDYDELEGAQVVELDANGKELHVDIGENESDEQDEKEKEEEEEEQPAVDENGRILFRKKKNNNSKRKLKDVIDQEIKKKEEKEGPVKKKKKKKVVSTSNNLLSFDQDA